MTRLGFEPGVDYPMVGDVYTAMLPHGYEYLLGLLHYFEFTNTKQASKEWFETKGDHVVAVNMDYDWADEAIHLSYGYKWMLHRLKGDSEKLEQIRNESFDIFNTWHIQNVINAPTEPFANFRKKMVDKVAVNHLSNCSAAIDNKFSARDEG